MKEPGMSDEPSGYDEALVRLTGRTTALALLLEVVFTQYWVDEPPEKAERQAREMVNLLRSDSTNREASNGDAVLYQECLATVERIVNDALKRAAAVRAGDSRILSNRA